MRRQTQRQTRQAIRSAYFFHRNCAHFWPTSVAAFAICQTFFVSACPRPPVEPVEPADAGIDADAGANNSPVDLSLFTQDEFAIGGDWYTYDPTDHALTPRTQSYVLRIKAPASDVPVGIAAEDTYLSFRPLSYYDPDTASSGRMTMQWSRFVDGVWQPLPDWQSSQNLKDAADKSICFNAQTQTETACTSTEWHLMLRLYPLLVRDGPLVIFETGIFLPQTGPQAAVTTIATVFDAEHPEGLPDPTTIPDLADAVPQNWESTDWILSSYAGNLPLQGMALGTRISSLEPDVLFLMTGRQKIYKLTVTQENTQDAPTDAVEEPAQDAETNRQLHIRWAEGAFSLADNTVSTFLEPQEVSISLAQPDSVRTAPTESRVFWLSLSKTDLILERNDIPAASAEAVLHTQDMPPSEKTWDLAVVIPPDTIDGTPMPIQIRLSPSTALFNATQRLDPTHQYTFDDMPLPTVSGL